MASHQKVGCHNTINDQMGPYLSFLNMFYHLEVGIHNFHHLSSFIIQKWDFTIIIIYHHLSSFIIISHLVVGILIYNHLSSFII